MGSRLNSWNITEPTSVEGVGTKTSYSWCYFVIVWDIGWLVALEGWQFDCVFVGAPTSKRQELRMAFNDQDRCVRQISCQTNKTILQCLLNPNESSANLFSMDTTLAQNSPCNIDLVIIALAFLMPFFAVYATIYTSEPFRVSCNFLPGLLIVQSGFRHADQMCIAFCHADRVVKGGQSDLPSKVFMVAYFAHLSSTLSVGHCADEAVIIMTLDGFQNSTRCPISSGRQSSEPSRRVYLTLVDHYSDYTPSFC
eukprot:2159318-Amphidinium_carterae.1